MLTAEISRKNKKYTDFTKSLKNACKSNIYNNFLWLFYRVKRLKNAALNFQNEISVN